MSLYHVGYMLFYSSLVRFIPLWGTHYNVVISVGKHYELPLVQTSTSTHRHTCFITASTLNPISPHLDKARRSQLLTVSSERLDSTALKHVTYPIKAFSKAVYPKDLWMWFKKKYLSISLINLIESFISCNCFILNIVVSILELSLSNDPWGNSWHSKWGQGHEIEQSHKTLLLSQNF